MKRIIVSLAFLLATTAALGQAYNPKIAYTRYEGNADNLYLANADGSYPVIVYKANKVRLGGIDIAPANSATLPWVGRIAFVQSGVLKILSYTVSATGITATAPTILDSTGAPYLGANHPDFSPNGSKILYTRFTSSELPRPAEVRLISADVGGIPKIVYSHSHFIGMARWIGTTDFAFNTDLGPSNSSEIYLATLDANDSLALPPSTMFTSGDPRLLLETGGLDIGIEDFDVARTKPSLLFSTGTASGGSNRYFIEYDMLTGAYTPHLSLINGRRPHFSSDDAYIFFLRVSPRSFNVLEYVDRFDTNSKSIIRLTTKGQFGYADSKP